jgi:hypothetical protein
MYRDGQARCYTAPEISLGEPEVTLTLRLRKSESQVKKVD